MKKLKPVILVLGPIVLAVGVWWTFFRGAPGVLNTIQFVNVVTGELKGVDRNSYTDIPLKDEAGKPVWFPVAKMPDGSYMFDGHYMSPLRKAIDEQQIDAKQLRVDLKTMVVNTAK